MKRRHVNKRHSAHGFKQNVSHTKLVNIQPKPMRGGYRL